MTPDREMMAAWFDEFNRNYFDNSLPVPRLSCGKSRTRLGTMSCRRQRTPAGWRSYDYSIRLSTYYELSEQELRTVLLHEMIHYYIAYKGICDNAPHGRVFRTIMDKLNTQYGWHITVSTSCAGLQPATGATTTKRRLVLAVETNDGRLMLSVVNPHYASAIDTAIKHSGEIKSHEWYTTRNAFFAAFPVVRSLRGRVMAHDEYNDLTSKMTKITLRP